MDTQQSERQNLSKGDEFHGANIYPHTTHGSGMDGSQRVMSSMEPTSTHIPHMGLAWTEVKG